MSSRYDEISEVRKATYETIEEVEKFNPYHDELGRFTFANAATAFAPLEGKTENGKRLLEHYKQTHNFFADKPTDDKPKKDKPVKDKPKKEQPKEEIKTRPKLEEGLGKEHAEKLEKLISSAPKEAQDLWNKYADEISVENANSQRAFCDSKTGAITVNIYDDANGLMWHSTRPPYASTFHESGHSIDRAISNKYGSRFSVEYNDREFEKTIVKEAGDYFKKRQKEFSDSMGRKVSISYTRTRVAMEMNEKIPGFIAEVSDMLNGATKGKFTGPLGHDKKYWTGYTTWWGAEVPGHSVAEEAFAEMFSATVTNPRSLEYIKEIFPKSYEVFQRMIKEAASYE